MNRDNHLLFAATEGHRNSERRCKWRHRYLIATGRMPDGNITAHGIAADRYLQKLRDADVLAARSTLARFGRAVLSALLIGKSGTL